MTTKEFYENSEIAYNEYNVPLKPNYPAIDSLAPHRGEMYQCTSAETHRIKLKYLTPLKPHFRKWLDANPGDKVKFIFVLPPDRFTTFSLQSYIEPSSKQEIASVKDASTSSEGVRSQNEADSSWIVQWGLEMDVSPLQEAKLAKSKKTTFATIKRGLRITK